ncbi:BLUF domain-containing protein [Lichenibacterium minor]|uniref:BLUF domain-containing protein n=1 Tax=Lichenibacterium minor TaxID=2316528 RepID=A0A4Q2U2Q5_9HYPH|nr:BLUF domain-containing protein [Lichenibacterium minor]RYC29137.1 BLUF domain-containing protein [Lichenibacterium minor]
MSDLYRLIYTSRNLLPGDEDAQAAAVDGILAVSKRNNARVGVTGALLFNAGSFAQVLEGSRLAVEATFERIQRDPRHSDVGVLQCEPVAARGFPNWSMAFVGGSPRGRELWGEFARRTAFDIGRMEADRLFAALLQIVEGEDAPRAAARPALAASAG